MTHVACAGDARVGRAAGSVAVAGEHVALLELLLLLFR